MQFDKQYKTCSGAGCCAGGYVEFFTGYGFRRLFGAEAGNAFLCDFLNEVLKGDHEIVDLKYLHENDLPAFSLGGQPVITVRCRNTYGQEILVQLQKAEEKFWKNRRSCFLSFPILKHIQGGGLGNAYAAVYVVGLLNFSFREGRAEPSRYRYDITEKDIEPAGLSGDNLNFICLELSKLTPSWAALGSRLERWLYVLKNLGSLDALPACLKDDTLENVFNVADLAHLSCEEVRKYEESLKHLRDIKNCIETAREEGRREGLRRYRLERARKLLDEPLLDDAAIAMITSLSVADVAGLREERRGC